MKAKDLVKKDVKSLEAELEKLHETYSKEYVKTKVGSKTEKVTNLRNIKKDIARIHTVLRSKERK